MEYDIHVTETHQIKKRIYYEIPFLILYSFLTFDDNKNSASSHFSDSQQLNDIFAYIKQGIPIMSYNPRVMKPQGAKRRHDNQ